MTIHYTNETERNLTLEEAIQVQMMLKDGWKQSHIASHYHTNQGRISEIKTGKLHPQSFNLAFG